MKLLLLCISASFVQIPSIILRYIPFCDEITEKQRKILIWSYAVILIMSGILLGVITKTGFLTVRYYKNNLLLVCIILAVTNGVVIKNRYMENIFVFGVTEILVIMLITVVSYTEARLITAELEWLLIIHSVVFCLVFMMLFPLLKKLVINTITPFLNTDSRDYWKNICIAPTAMFFAITIAFPMDQYVQTFTPMFCRCLISIAVLCLCQGVAYDYEMMEKKESLSRTLNEQKEYFSVLSNKVHETRKARHDLRHHLLAIQSCAEAGDLEQIKEYCEELLQTGITEPFVPFFGNSVVDGIIYHYIQLCERENIHFENHGVLQETTVSDTDLCVLLGNALENAYTACKKLGTGRFIDLYFQIDMGYLGITVENSFDGQLNMKHNRLLSSKRKDEPGIGLESVRDICKRYDGDMMVNHTESTFRVMCLLKASLRLV